MRACYYCGLPVSKLDGAAHPECRKRRRALARRQREAAVDSGICTRCGVQPLVEPTQWCKSCAAAGARSRIKLVAKRRDQGLCRCGNTQAKGSSRCQQCIDKRTEADRRKQLLHICVKCNRKAHYDRLKHVWRRLCRYHLDYYAARMKAKGGQP